MPVEVGEIRKEGWVSKESAVIRTYRKRWMVLTPDRLYSFKREKQYSDPTEEIDLRQCGTVKSADDLTNRPYSFTVQVPERHFFLAAANDADRNEWVAAIGRATTESRRVRSYSEEVEHEEQQARLAKAKRLQAAQPTIAAAAEEGAAEPATEPDDVVPARAATRFT
mmetsp:Transcript_13786/g.27957  ORF Transcript_13786/g.27957 Transcript_13786/m.27957 type:complete len:167 (+) Transcript_13786:66-566(+)